MVKAALVSTDIERGKELVGALERAKLKIGAALWAVLPEYEDWRLVLSARQFDSPNTRGGYDLLHEVLDPAGFTPGRIPTITILPMNDPFIRDLRRRYRKFKDVEGMRPGGQIGNRFIEDGYVYRIS